MKNNELIMVKVEGELFVSKADYDKLAAKCALYNKAHPQPFGPEMMKAIDAYKKDEDEIPENGMLNAFFILRDSIVINDEQITAAIAEFKAQGVDELVNRAFISYNHQHPAVSEFIHLCQNYAAQLRAGVAK